MKKLNLICDIERNCVLVKSQKLIGPKLPSYTALFNRKPECPDITMRIAKEKFRTDECVNCHWDKKVGRTKRNFYCSCKLCDYALHYFVVVVVCLFFSENNSENSACAENQHKQCRLHQAGKNLQCPVINLPKHFISFARDSETGPYLSKDLLLAPTKRCN